MSNMKSVRVDEALWKALVRWSRPGDRADAVIRRVLSGKGKRRGGVPGLPEDCPDVVNVSRDTWGRLAKRAIPFETPCRCLRRLLGIPKPGTWGGVGAVSMDPEIWALMGDGCPRDALRWLLNLKTLGTPQDQRWTRCGATLMLSEDLWKVLRKKARPFESPRRCLRRLLGLAEKKITKQGATQ